MANADISLLFGVLGEGSLSGESGSLIQSQLTQIMAALNKNPLKVKVALDTDAGGQKSWSSQLQKKLDTLSSSDKFGIKVQLSKLTLGAGAISDFRKQLTAIVNTLNLDKGTSITLTADGIGEIKSKMKQAGDAASDAARKTAEFKVQIEALNRQKTAVQRAISSLSTSATTEEERAKVAELTAQYEQWAIKIEQIRASKTAAPADYRAEIEAEGAAISNNITKLNEERAAAEAAAAAAKAAAAERAAAEQEAASATEHSATAGKDAAAAQKDLDAARKQGLTLLTQMQKAERDWTRAKTGKSSAEYGQIQASIRNLQAYLAQLRSGEIDVTTFRQHLTELSATFASSSNAIKVAGENTKTFGERIGGLAKKFSAWFSVTRVIMTVINTIRKMVNNTREIDKSMTQLRIVTGATDEEMEAFLTRSTVLAKRLGQSITDVLGSIETFSRLGYNLEDASQLAEFASVLSNVAAVDTDAATTGLTSIIKGFNMDVAESEHVADVLVEVGQKYAVSAGEMMEAYEKSGAALNAANTSFEKSAGLIAAANASVQNASTVGTALKTISARIRGATADLEALGEDTQDLAEGFSKYAKEIKALTGFDIMVDGSTDTYKDIYDIFEGISKVWDDLSDTQQARVSEILGGTRQLQVISSILGNWKDAAGAYAEAMNSAGVAAQANATYMESISGRIGTFNATFQEFSNNLLNSGLVKFFVDMGTAILTALNALQELHLLLPMVVSVVVAIKGIRAALAAMRGAAMAAETASTINTIVSRLVAEKGATDALAMSIANLSIAEKAELVTKIQAAVASGTLTAAEAEQILTTLGLAGAEGALTAANKGLAASFKSLMASIPVWGWIALGISLVITVVTTLTSSIKSSEERLEELNQEFKELASKVKTVESEFRSLRDSAEEVIPQFSKLAKGVNQFGENVSLTDEEYEEFLSLNNRIAEMFPEINLGMDSNGNAMLALSYSADTLTASLYALVEAERQAANEEIAKTMPDVISNITSAEGEYRKQIDEARDTIEEWQEVYDDIVNRTLPETIGRYATQEAGMEAGLKFIEKAQRLGIHGGFYEDTANNAPNNGHLYKVQWEYDTADLQYAKEVLDSIIAGQENIIHNYEGLIEARWSELNRVVGHWTETNFLYNDLNNQMQGFAKTMISGIDFATLGLDTEEKVQNYVEDYILRPLFLAAPEVKEAFASLTDWQEALKNGALTEEEFREKTRAAFDQLLSSVQPEKVDAFTQAFVAGFSSIGIAGDDFNSIVEGIIDNWSAVAGIVSDGGDVPGEIKDLAESITDLQKAYDLLAEAQKEMENGGLSAETIEKLANAQEDYLDYLYEENGIIKLNTEAWEENAKAKMQNNIAILQSELEALEEENRNSETRRRNLIRLGASPHNGNPYQEEIDELTDTIEANGLAITEHQRKLALYETLYGNITGDLNAYAEALNNFTNIANTIDTVSNSFQTLADLQATVANGFTLSLEKALEFAKVYPEILNNAQVSADGQITLNEGVVNTFLQGKKAELDAQIDAEIAKLEADKAVLEAKMEAAQAQLDLAKSVGEGEGQISKELAEYRINAGNAVAQALIDAGVDEATAFKLAALAMAQNAEEFDRVAMEVCTDVNGNFNQAAYDLAQTMYKNLTNVKTDLASVAKQAHETAKAIAGIASGNDNAGSAAIQGGSGGGSGGSGIKLNLTSGSFEGTEYTYEAKESNLEDFISQIELDISNYESAIAQINGQIATLQALKNIPLKEFKSDTKGGKDDSGSTDEVEEYIATIDDYREAIERLRKAQESVESLELQIDNAGSYEKKIELQKKLVDAYKEEQDALHNLNNQRDSTITAGVEALRELGFAVEYNADTNDLWISNMEHLNELQADSCGSYDSLQEATNALREETEGLIDDIEELNEANREGSATWLKLRDSIRATTIAMYENAIKARENYITLTENWLENAIESDNADDVKKHANAIVGYYRDMQKSLHDEAEYYRSLGYSDTSDEVSALSDKWWEYEANIKEVKQKVIDHLNDMVTRANDVVDGFQNVYTTLTDAAKEYAQNGYLSVDSLQAILELGPKYLAFLHDENGQLVINEESLQRVIAAKTEEMAAETALSYAKQALIAAEHGETETLAALTQANATASSATWDMAYATIGLAKAIGVAKGMDAGYFDDAVSYIQKMQSLNKTAISTISSYYKTLDESYISQKDGLEKILELTKDMIRHENEEMIDALEGQKDAYADIVSLRKEAIEAAEKERKYDDDIEDKIRKIAKLQERINTLSLDDSRDAQSEKIRLEEEMYELQKELADSQGEHAIDAQTGALEEMQKAYEDQKDDEIAVLENTLSSEEKLYQAAIARIGQGWDALYKDLLDWNYNYGSTLQSELVSAWDAASAAVQRYGSFVSALSGVQNYTNLGNNSASGNFPADGTGGGAPVAAALLNQMRQNSIAHWAATDSERAQINSNQLDLAEQYRQITGDDIKRVDGAWYKANGERLYKLTQGEVVSAIVARMKQNSAAHSAASDSGKKALSDENLVLGSRLGDYLGKNVHRDSNGVWWIDGKRLYDVYHKGGIAGNQPTLRQDEVMAVLKKGEPVLDKEREEGLYRIIDFVDALGSKLGKVISGNPVVSSIVGAKSGLTDLNHTVLESITNNQNRTVQFGNVIIYGANEETVEKHREVNRRFTNEVLRQLNIKK